MKKRHQQKLIVLSVSLMFIWNIPLMMLFDQDIIVWGFPFFYFSIFLSWLLAVGIAYFMIKRYDR